MVEDFSPGLTLTRTQTIMEGASQCDFPFRAQSRQTRYGRSDVTVG